MAGIENCVYNSDCVYISTTARIFAVSDPPGITDSARRLFERLDRFLRDTDDMACLVNRLNREMPQGESAALCLVHLPADQPGTAVTVIAGDALLFQGNAGRRTIRAIAARTPFLGTPYAVFQAGRSPLPRMTFSF